MGARENSTRDGGTAVLPPRERILAVATDLFYREGIRAVGVDAIAQAAGTNKMTLYRHFPSKDALVTEYLRRWAEANDGRWRQVAEENAGDPVAQLRGYLRAIAELVSHCSDRGCALANAAIELPDKAHPGRRVIESFKAAHRKQLVEAARSAGLNDPELLADELHLLVEGARVTAQSLGPEGLAERLVRIGEVLISAHGPAPAASLPHPASPDPGGR